MSTYVCRGPTTNNRALLQNCQANVKSGLLPFSSSNAKKCVRKYTNTWAVGDSVTVRAAGRWRQGARVGGRGPPWAELCTCYCAN